MRLCSPSLLCLCLCKAAKSAAAVPPSWASSVSHRAATTPVHTLSPSPPPLFLSLNRVWVCRFHSQPPLAAPRCIWAYAVAAAAACIIPDIKSNSSGHHLSSQVSQKQEQMTEKNPRWGPVGDQIPAGDGDGEEFFTRNGEWSGDGGRGSDRGRGWGVCSPSPTRPVAISMSSSLQAFVNGQDGTHKPRAVRKPVGSEEPLIKDVGTPSRMGSFNDCQASEGSHAKVLNVDALEVGEVQSQQPSDATSIPPGFEVVKVSSARQGRTNKSQVDYIGKRLTRSQSKQCKEPAGRSKSIRNRSVSGLEGRVESPLESDSGGTTESTRKLAEESLELGELLGLKVVAHKENAIKRITQSLKTARVPKSNHKTKRTA